VYLNQKQLSGKLIYIYMYIYKEIVTKLYCIQEGFVISTLSTLYVFLYCLDCVTIAIFIYTKSVKSGNKFYIIA
jgi:hypothetical protein